MKPKIPFLIFALFMSLGIHSSAQLISAVATIDEYGNGNFQDFGGGTVHVQTQLDWWLETSSGTKAEITIAAQHFHETAYYGALKQGSRVVYPGDVVFLYAEVLNEDIGRFNRAISYIYVHEHGAIH